MKRKSASLPSYLKKAKKELGKDCILVIMLACMSFVVLIALAYTICLAIQTPESVEIAGCALLTFFAVAAIYYTKQIFSDWKKDYRAYKADVDEVMSEKR